MREQVLGVVPKLGKEKVPKMFFVALTRDTFIDRKVRANNTFSDMRHQTIIQFASCDS